MTAGDIMLLMMAMDGRREQARKVELEESEGARQVQEKRWKEMFRGMRMERSRGDEMRELTAPSSITASLGTGLEGRRRDMVENFGRWQQEKRLRHTSPPLKLT